MPNYYLTNVIYTIMKQLYATFKKMQLACLKTEAKTNPKKTLLLLSLIIIFKKLVIVHL